MEQNKATHKLYFCNSIYSSILQMTSSQISMCTYAFTAVFFKGPVKYHCTFLFKIFIGPILLLVGEYYTMKQKEE